MVKLTPYIDNAVKTQFPSCSSVSVGEDKIIFHGLNENERLRAQDFISGKLLDLAAENKMEEVKATAYMHIKK